MPQHILYTNLKLLKTIAKKLFAPANFSNRLWQPRKNDRAKNKIFGDELKSRFITKSQVFPLISTTQNRPMFALT